MVFDSLKQIGKLKELKNTLQKEEIELEEKGVKLKINGELKLIDLKLNPDLPLSDQEKIILKLFNKGVKEIQSKIVKKLSGFSNFF